MTNTSLALQELILFHFGLFKFFCVSRKVEWIKLDMFRLEKILALSLYFCYDQKKNHLHDFTTALSFLIAIKYFQKEEKDSRTAKNINQIKSNQGRTKVIRKFQVRKKKKKTGTEYSGSGMNDCVGKFK